jgi:hypothetical protein
VSDLPSFTNKERKMNKDIFAYREKIRAAFLIHGLDPADHSDLVTDLALIAMDYIQTDPQSEQDE